MAEANDTRGLSQRELILEMRKDIKEMKRENSKRPTRTEVYGTVGTVAILLALGQAFLP